MNNYLLLTNDQAQIENYLKAFTRSHQISPSQIFRFASTSTMAVEEFRHFLKLTQVRFDRPHLFILEGFDNFSTIIQNTFLKTLEEHQPTLSFILTSQSLGSVLPTIISRCTVKVLPSLNQKLSIQEKNEYETTIAAIKKSGLASSVIKLGLKDKKQKALAWLENFLKYGYQQLPNLTNQNWLNHCLKRAIINHALIKNNNLDPETALDQVFLS